MPDRPHELPSKTHFLLIHCRDGSEEMIPTLREAMAHWQPVWIILEGPALALEKRLKTISQAESSLRVLTPKSVHGKASAVLHARELAAKKHFTHVLIMAADGSHPAVRIRDFMALSFQHPEAMILGRPVPMASQPSPVVRWISNLPFNLLTCGAGIGEAAYGYNLFPLSAVERSFREHRAANTGKFDAEMKIRSLWAGVNFAQVPCPVRPPSNQTPGARTDHGGPSVKMLARLLISFPGQLLRARHWGQKLSASSCAAP